MLMGMIRRWNKVRVASWFIIVGLGAINAFAFRNEMNPDGISYLDIADAFVRGDWHIAFNRYWSPLYPALIATTFRALRPSPYWEFAAVHLLNLVILAGALVSFEFLLNELIQYRRSLSLEHPTEWIGLPEWGLRTLGYSFFAYTSLPLMGLVTPDLCVSAIVYLASGLLLRMTLSRVEEYVFPLLGAVLGIGYFAKAAMFPLALVFLVLGAAFVYSHSTLSEASLRLMAGLGAFTALASVLVLVFLLNYGRLTWGDSAKLNYAWTVNGLPIIHWQGGHSASGSPVHPSRKIFARPPVYEFGVPLGGMYPPWFDPAYWYEGVKPHFDERGQLQVLKESAVVILLTFFRGQGSLAVLAVVLLHMGGRPGLFPRHITSYTVVLIPAITAFAMFSLVHFELRFVTAFITLLWLALFAAIPWPASRRDYTALKGLIAAALAVLITTSGNLGVIPALNRELFLKERSFPQWTMAQYLHRIGIRRGDEVAVIGYSFGAFWARLSGTRIVAEMPACVGEASITTCAEGQPDGTSAFLAADPATRNRILAAFAQTGARAVVIMLPIPAFLSGWQRVPKTDCYVYLLRPQHFRPERRPPGKSE
jgi:hypothetical protein